MPNPELSLAFSFSERADAKREATVFAPKSICAFLGQPSRAASWAAQLGCKRFDRLFGRVEKSWRSKSLYRDKHQDRQCEACEDKDCIRYYFGDFSFPLIPLIVAVSRRSFPTALSSPLPLGSPRLPLVPAVLLLSALLSRRKA